MLPFCSKNSGPILITPWSHEKRYQALAACTHVRVPEKPGNEAKLSRCQSYLGMYQYILHINISGREYGMLGLFSGPFDLHMSAYVCMTHISLQLHVSA